MGLLVTAVGYIKSGSINEYTLSNTTHSLIRLRFGEIAVEVIIGLIIGLAMWSINKYINLRNHSARTR